MFEGILQGDGGIWTKRPKVGFDVDENVLNRHHPNGDFKHLQFSVLGLADGGQPYDALSAGRRHHLRRREHQSYRSVCFVVDEARGPGQGPCFAAEVGETGLPTGRGFEEQVVADGCVAVVVKSNRHVGRIGGVNRNHLIVKRKVSFGQFRHHQRDVQRVVHAVVDVKSQQVDAVATGCRRVGMNQRYGDRFRGLTFHRKVGFRAAHVPRHDLPGFNVKHLTGLH